MYLWAMYALEKKTKQNKTKQKGKKKKNCVAVEKVRK